MTLTIPFALVIDDDALFRLDATHISEQAGFRCVDVETADEARAVLTMKGVQIILLFTDLQMPGELDGFRPRALDGEVLA